MHGRGGQDIFIDIPVGTLVYKIIKNKSLSNNSIEDFDDDAFKEYEAQMYNHFGEQFDEIKKSEEEMEKSEGNNEDTDDNELYQKELLFDSSISQSSDVFCIARGGKGGEGNHDWYERSKRKNLRNWGSNRDRRLQATYYRVFH